MVVDSKKKLLSGPEIIVKSLQDTDLKGYPVQAVLAGVIKELTLPGADLKSFGNTAFITHRSPKNKNWVIVRALNVDTAKNLIDNCEAYLKFLIDSKVERMGTFPMTGNEFTTVFKIIQRKPFTKKLKIQFQTKNNQTMVVVDMGPNNE